MLVPLLLTVVCTDLIVDAACRLVKSELCRTDFLYRAVHERFDLKRSFHLSVVYTL